MQQIIYRRGLGEKKRKAAGSYVRRVNRRVAIVGRPEASVGPEGEVLVSCPFDLKSQARKKTAQRAMAEASYDVLDASGVWVVGLLQNTNGHSSHL